MSKQKFKTDVPILSVGAVAKSLNVHQRTLRIYDEQGILVPQRSKLNRRLYTLDDIERGKFILFLTRNLAINLAGVKIILRLLETSKVKPDDYMSYINKLATSINIDETAQEQNIQKLSKRGKRLNQPDVDE